MYLYREATHNLRKSFRLHSNIYMNPEKTVAEMYASNHKPSYPGCFWGAVKDALSEAVHGAPDYD